MSGLYAIVDITSLDRLGLDAVAFAESLLAVGAATLQLRAKDVPGGRTLSLARRLAALANERRVPFFVNDRVDIALLVGAGVHLGQDDLTPADAAALARAAGADLPIGFSTHDEGQVDTACSLPISYLAIGPVHATDSKLRHDPVLGMGRARALAERAKARCPGLPVVAIGGITVSAAAELRSSFDAIAVIAGLLPTADADSGRRAMALRDAFMGTRA